MKQNIIIEFEPKNSYKDWIFNGIVGNNKKLDYFSKKQIEDLVNITISRIPKRLLDVFCELDWKMIITNTRNLEEECNSNIKIYGYTNFEKKEINVYATKEGIEQSIPHEFAHFLDSLINLTTSYEWQKVYEEEKDSFKMMSSYFTYPNLKTECFSDAFMVFIIDNTQLRRYSPKTYKIINNIFEYIEYIIDKDIIDNIKIKEKEKDDKLLSSLEISCFKEGVNYW